MPIVKGYPEGLRKDLIEQGLDPESGLGREIMKQFQFSFELHERVKALEDRERNHDLGGIKKELQDIKGVLEQIVNTMPERLIVENISMEGSAPLPMRKAFETDQSE